MIDLAPSRYPVPALSMEENDTIEQERPGTRSLLEIHHPDVDPSSTLLEAALFIDQDACDVSQETGRDTLELPQMD